MAVVLIIIILASIVAMGLALWLLSLPFSGRNRVVLEESQ